MAGWTIPMGSQVSVEAARQRRLNEEAQRVVDGFRELAQYRNGDTLVFSTGTHGRHCPCTPCRAQDWTEPNLAPCGMHGAACCGDPADCTEDCSDEEPHVGHFSRLGGTWWCDTCNSPYCELA